MIRDLVQSIHSPYRPWERHESEPVGRSLSSFCEGQRGRRWSRPSRLEPDGGSSVARSRMTNERQHGGQGSLWNSVRRSRAKGEGDRVLFAARRSTDLDNCEGSKTCEGQWGSPSYTNRTAGLDGATMPTVCFVERATKYQKPAKKQSRLGSLEKSSLSAALIQSISSGSGAMSDRARAVCRGFPRRCCLRSSHSVNV